jgi:hypothetical protein
MAPVVDVQVLDAGESANPQVRLLKIPDSAEDRRLGLFIRLFPKNYVIIGFLGLLLLWFVVVTLARAQTDAARPPQNPTPAAAGIPVIKPLPAELQAEFRAAQDEVATLQARLSAATLRGQNVLYRAALELKMTAKEVETCEVRQVSQGGAPAAWSFVCPPEPVQTPTPTPKAGK